MSELESFDSKEEWYFDLWLKELSSYGLVDNQTYHPKPFLLSDKVSLNYIKALKKKSKAEDAHLLASHEYQADWIVYWNKKLLNVLFSDLSASGRSPKDYPFIVNWSTNRGSFFSVIDIKGTFNQNDAYRRFSIEQKWVYQKYHIYVQKVIPMPSVSKAGKASPASALFLTTFMPERATKTDKQEKDRIIKFKYRLIGEFLSDFGL